MQSLDPETGKNQSHSTVPIPGITLSESWRSAFGKLSAGCLSNARAVILIGERGVGKASLIEAWRDQSASAFQVVTLDEATGEPDQVVANLAHQMGVDTADLGRGAILAAITASVQASKQAGKETVVIVDNADEIPSNTVELLMVLARDRGSNKPLLRYIFSGSKKLRKSLRLDGGAARRQNYVIVEMERFSADETKAFVSANLSRASDVTIADDAAAYLHESTSGKPANILTVLDKVQSGRMAEGETEITKAHIQSLVKAPRAIGAASKKPRPKSEVALADNEEDLSNGVSGNLNSSDGNGTDKNFAEPGNVFATNADLPDSIRNVNDPRPLLRWAFGLEEHSETEALANRAEAAAVASAGRGKDKQASHPPEDLNAALAKVAERERAERNPPPEPTVEPVEPAEEPKKPTPELNSIKPEAESTLDHMIQGETFAFEEGPAATPRAARNPEELKTELRKMPPVPSRRTNKVVLAAGVAVMGVAALGVLWTALQPSEIANPLDGSNAPQQTASLGTPVEPNVVTETTANNVAASSTPSSTVVVGDGEPDLAGVIALMKSPDVLSSDAGSASALRPFQEDAPRIVTAGYLAPSGSPSGAENSGLRKAIVADMAASERVELEGEERRLMEQLNALEEQVAEKQSVLSSLERAVIALSSQARESGDLIDTRKSEIEVVTSRLAFITRDEAQAEQRLAAASSEASNAENKLQTMRDELAASEALIVENRTLLDESQTNTANLGEAVAKREADYAALTRKVEEAEALLNERQEELAAVLAQQKEAKTELADLQGELEIAKSSQEEVEAELTRLRDDRTAQIAAAETLKGDVSDANGRLTAANAQLAKATAALTDRTVALDEITNRTKAAKSQLDGLVAQLDNQKTVVSTSNQELAALTGQRNNLEAELVAKAAQIERANGQLEALETNQQTASNEFEALTERKSVLQADLETGEVLLENLTAELNEKKVAVEALVVELEDGANRITSQRAELSSLKALAADVGADQSSAQATVTAEQSQVASAAGELEALKSQQVEMAAALTEIETLTITSQRELDAIRQEKSEAEQEIAAAVQRLKDIKAQEVAAESGVVISSGNKDEKLAELAVLDGRISSSNKELEAVVSKTAALNAQLSDLTKAGTAKLREQQTLLDQVTLQLEDKQAALASLTQQIDAVKSDAPVAAVEETASLETVTVPAVRVRPAAATNEPVATVELTETAPIVETPQQQSGTGLSPRDSGLVISALTDAPGLGRAPQDKKDQLQAALIRGECVTDALKETFGRVNPHTLVALLESMEMCGS